MVSNGNLKIGLHETDLWEGERITYTARGMSDKIWALEKNGLRPYPQMQFWNNGRSMMSELQTPDKHRFLLLKSITTYRWHKYFDKEYADNQAA